MKYHIRKTSIYYISAFSFLLFGITFFSYLSSSPVFAADKTLSQFGKSLTAGEMSEFSQNNILFYNPAECDDSGSGGTLAGTGDFDAILKAKNADKSFFNGEGDVPSAQWSDTDTGSMKTLLETYGDLAYQLGRAVGAPYIAILVQMRYEDPQSVCGKNNFWGNGCDPSHAYAGGATIQGDNLGEGFVQYGKTLTNGMHDQALGVADPKEYLTKIGPTWVQGNINGAGYGSIDGMKKSVDALTAYIESSEGQAIVKQFSNYQGGGTSSSSGGTSSSGGGTSSSSGSSYKDETVWEDGWITGGFEGYIKEPAEGSGYELPEEGVKGGHTQDYATGGKPNKILLHSTEGGPGDGTSGLSLYGAVEKGGLKGPTPAHFTIDLQNKRVFQHFSINKPSDAIIEDLDAGVQIEIIGFMDEGNSPALPTYSDGDWDYLAKLLVAISSETGIKLNSSADWTHTNRYSEEDFHSYTGVLGHMHAPSSENHDDPGDIWSNVDAAIARVRGDSCTGGDSDVLSSVEEIIELANKNGSTYTWGGGHTSDASVFDDMLNGSPINVDCTGFASLVMYKTHGEMTSFTSESIFSDPLYKEVNRADVKPGDIFAYNSPSGHGGIVIEVSDGVVTKIAETGGSGGQSGSNTNIGYAGSESFSIQNMNGSNGHFFRWNGPENGSKSISGLCDTCEGGDTGSHSGGFTSAEEADKVVMQPYRDLAREGNSDDWNKYNITGGSWYNCFSFSNYFISRYTNIDFHGVGGSGGGGYAKNFYNSYHGSYPDLKMSDKPTPYSVAGCGDEEYIDGVTVYSHTFIVLGVDTVKGTMIYGEAALGSGEGGILAAEISLTDPAYGSRNGSTGICTYTDFSKYVTGL